MRAHLWRARSGYRRTALIGAISTVLLVWGLGSASSQAAEPPVTVPFSNGVAKATAVVTKVAPGVGSLELALANGIAVSELKNQLGQAQAQSLDLGLIGTTLTAGGCRNAAVTPDQLPQPTRVDNRKGDASATTDEVPIADSVFGGGRETAWATTVPLAGAIATSAASFGPVVTVRGGQARATTEIIDGAARQAHATVDAGLEIAGVVDLAGLRWDAIHRTGRDPHAEATFDIGTAKLFGVPIPLESLASLEQVLNEALASTGISIQFPTIERFTEPADLVRVTPLRIVLKDSPLGKTVLSPVLDLSREQRSQMFDTLAAAICDAAGILLVGDISVSIVGGTGFLAVEVGGAEATTGELVLENPFGTPTAPPALGPVTGPAPPVLPPGPAFIPTGAAGPATPPAAPERAASVGPLEELCETIHPFRSPSCSKGAMAPLGLLGLVATVGVAGLDWRHQRKRSLAATRAPAATA
ncbi:MAG: hypothetical protein ACRDZU_07560 [Acidimicrobiales bacterium]